MSPTSSSPAYDSAYRRLFLHPRMVEDLLTCMVEAPDLVEDLDFARMAALDSVQVSETHLRRETDLLLRIPRKSAGARDVYLCVLLEFQATSDWWMTHRLLLVQCLAYEKLAPRGVSGAKIQGTLAPIIPLVIYHGKTAWDKPTHFQALLDIDDAWPLKDWLPRFRFWMLSERFDDPNALRRPKGPTALLLRSYQSTSREALLGLGDALRDIAQEDQALVQGFVSLWYRVIEVTRGVVFPEPPIAPQEALRMWSDNINKIFEDTKQEGMLSGRRQGLEEGMEQGLQQGLQQGTHEGQLAAMRSNALAIYNARFAEVSPTLAQAVKTMSLAALQALIPRLATQTQDEIDCELDAMA